MALPKRAAIYARISDDREGKAAGVTRQLKDCRALAKTRTWTVADVYTDNDVSAYSGKHRPEYERLIEDIRGHRVDAVLVWHLDRLHRSPLELEHFVQVCDEAKLRHVATVTGDLDMADGDGLFNARILTAVARKSSDDMARRIRRKHEELADAGKVSGGGSRPFGYLPDRITLDKREAALIRKAAQRVLLGDSLRAICRDWNDAGVWTTMGKEWRSNVLRRVLMSGRIAGRREHHGKILDGPAVWPAVVDDTTARRVRALLDAPSRRTYERFMPRSYLLGGFLRCGVCGSLLRSRGRPHGARAYACKQGPGFGGKGCVQVAAEPLEELVSAMVFQALDSPALAKAIAAHHEPEAEDTDAEDEEQLAQLARDFADRRISRSEWLVARDAIQRRLDESRASAARQNGTSVIASFAGKTGALERAWPGLSLDRKRTIIGAALDHVAIARAKRNSRGALDLSRVSVTWRV